LLPEAPHLAFGLSVGAIAACDEDGAVNPDAVDDAVELPTDVTNPTLAVVNTT